MFQNIKIYVVWLIIIFAFSLNSCAKEKINNKVRQIEVDADYRVNDIFFINQNKGFAVGGSRYEEAYILKTENAGQSWERIPENNISTNEENKLQTLNAIHFYDENIGQVVGHGGKILRTLDGGNTWEYIISPSWSNFSDVYMHSPDETILTSFGAFSDGGIFQSKTNWYEFEHVEITFAARSICFINQNIGFIAGYGIVQKTEDNGKTWSVLDIRNDYFFDIDFPSENVGYVCGWEGGIYKTTNQGATWKTVNANNKVFSKRQHFENIDFIDEQTGVVCGYKGEVLYTKNGGETWQKLETNTKEDFHSIYFHSQNTVFVGGENGLLLELTIP